MISRIKVKGLTVSEAYAKAIKAHEWQVSSNGSRIVCTSCKVEFAYFSFTTEEKRHKRNCSYAALARELGVELAVREGESVKES